MILLYNRKNQCKKKRINKNLPICLLSKPFCLLERGAPPFEFMLRATRCEVVNQNSNSHILITSSCSLFYSSPHLPWPAESVCHMSVFILLSQADLKNMDFVTSYNSALSVLGGIILFLVLYWSGSVAFFSIKNFSIKGQL